MGLRVLILLAAFFCAATVGARADDQGSGLASTPDNSDPPVTCTPNGNPAKRAFNCTTGDLAYVPANQLVNEVVISVQDPTQAGASSYQIHIPLTPPQAISAYETGNQKALLAAVQAEVSSTSPGAKVIPTDARNWLQKVLGLNRNTTTQFSLAGFTVNKSSSLTLSGSPDGSNPLKTDGCEWAPARQEGLSISKVKPDLFPIDAPHDPELGPDADQPKSAPELIALGSGPACELPANVFSPPPPNPRNPAATPVQQPSDKPYSLKGLQYVCAGSVRCGLQKKTVICEASTIPPGQPLPFKFPAGRQPPTVLSKGCPPPKECAGSSAQAAKGNNDPGGTEAGNPNGLHRIRFTPPQQPAETPQPQDDPAKPKDKLEYSSDLNMLINSKSAGGMGVCAGVVVNKGGGTSSAATSGDPDTQSVNELGVLAVCLMDTSTPGKAPRCPDPKECITKDRRCADPQQSIPPTYSYRLPGGKTIPPAANGATSVH